MNPPNMGGKKMKKVSYVVLLFVVSVLSSVSSSYAYAADINHIYDVGEIMLYDGTSITQLTNNDYNDSCPQINDNGWVVWEACVGQTQDWCDRDEEIFLYDGTSTTQIGEGAVPQINNDGWVVWKSGVKTYLTEIFLYDGTRTTQLGKSSKYFPLYPPEINNNGWVVWVVNEQPPRWGLLLQLCFVATAAFGTELDGKIDVLRSFRDMYLQNHPVGQAFLSAYNKYSPPIADYVAGRPWLRSLVRILLLPVIGVVSLVV